MLLNSGGCVQKTIYGIHQDATLEQIKDIVLQNHSNLKTSSQRSHAYTSISRKPDEALQTYNSRYESHFCLANAQLNASDQTSMFSCTHYAFSLFGKLSNKMEGRFNQEMPESLQAAFEKAVSFKPQILTKQSINTRKFNEVNQIDVSNCDDEFEVNEVHVRNPNYKGKNYDPNYQNKNKNNTNSFNSTNNLGSGYKSNTSNNGWNYNNKNSFQDKPMNV